MRALICFGVFLCSMPLSFAGAPKAIFRSSLIAIEDIKPNNLTFEVAQDGTRYVALRLRSNDANAVRAHIRNVHLGAGQSLFVYSPAGRIVYGPFEGAGPLQSGEFWSQPVPGPEIVIEFQPGAEQVGDLPFNVDAVEPAVFRRTIPERRTSTSQPCMRVTFCSVPALTPREKARLPSPNSVIAGPTAPCHI